jgi:hypothetical protein
MRGAPPGDSSAGWKSSRTVCVLGILSRAYAPRPATHHHHHHPHATVQLAIKQQQFSWFDREKGLHLDKEGGCADEARHVAIVTAHVRHALAAHDTTNNT